MGNLTHALFEPVRMALKALPHSTRLPILSGENRGLNWYIHSFNFGAWAGWYEKNVQNCFAQHIEPETVVYDCGAAAGFFTLLAARLTKNPSRVICFEPSPPQLDWLQKNLHVNHFENVQIVPKALSDHVGVAHFTLDESGRGGLAKNGIEVPLTTLDSVMAELPPPDFIKIDIETAEVAALKGATNLLQKIRPKICLACHGGPLFPACADILRSYDYDCTLIEGTFEIGTTLWIPNEKMKRS